MKRLNTILIYVFVILAMLWILFPFYWLTCISFMNLGELAMKPPKFIPSLNLINYIQVIFGGAIGSTTSFKVSGTGVTEIRSILPTMLNSVLIGLSVAGLTVALACPAGFAYARFDFRLKRASFYSMFAVRILPTTLLVIPLFTIFRSLKIINTHLGLTLAHLILTLPFATWIFMDYINALPKELEEAALIDGATYFQAFWRIVLRASLPGVLSVALFAFLTSWGEFLFALTLTNQLTIPPVLLSYISSQNAEYTQFAAAAVLSIIPPVMLATVFQKYLIRGLTGALKA
ncbi:carbohydrate ABC transporter permease [Candidatus Bathyarchaeota archaeon]|nr:carbohydrate ABC transporter permease [Candidatus Bathyarchaeota archaeon]